MTLPDATADVPRSQAEWDRALMAAALSLGRRNRGMTAPNPAVGALVVRFEDGRPVVLARGWTSRGGRPHAERNALEAAGAAARGATCYVTLEPCSHHGATLPCSDALVASGVARVVTALEDPNPAVAGRGHAALRAAGIAVDTDVLRAEALAAHAGHVSRMTRGRPHVCLKMAVSADGFIGRDGDGQVPISCEASRREAHLMRATFDAILVGIGTVLADDPQLTCRLPGLAGRSPVRVVLDSHLATPPDARMIRDIDAAPVWILAAAPADPARRAALESRGATVIEAAADRSGRLDPDAALAALGRHGITTVMVEGGARVAAGLLVRDLVDEAAIVRAPLVVGAGGVPAFAEGSVDDLFADPRFRLAERRPLGADVLHRFVRRDNPHGLAGRAPAAGSDRPAAGRPAETPATPGHASGASPGGATATAAGARHRPAADPPTPDAALGVGG